ncbi:hypothetical protein SLA2020_400140 [Shorea laevis]
MEEAIDGLTIVPDKNSPPETGSVVATDTTGTGKARISYKEKLTNAGGHEDEWKDWSDTEEDDPLLEKWEAMENTVAECKWPNVVFTKEEKELMWKPWRKSLIIKPLHHSIGYTVLCGRAKHLWSLEGDFHAIDVGHGCFIFRFSKREDYKRVLTGGPWNVGGYCVVVRRWSPYFRSDEDHLEKITAWVRVPQAPIWCYNDIGLNRVGEQIGKVIKLDYLSQYACRGKYAKFCVELDLTKPLLPMVCIEGREHKVEYDGLDVVCFSCFRYGHRRENCPEKQATTSQQTIMELVAMCGKAPATPNAPASVQQSTLIKEDDYGSWMIVQRRNRRQPAYGKNGVTNASNMRDSRAGSRNGNNNRFAALRIDDGSNQNVQRSSNPGNSRKNFGEAGAKNGNPNGQIASIANRDAVTSIKEGGSSRATHKVLSQVTKWQRKEKGASSPSVEAGPSIKTQAREFSMARKEFALPSTVEGLQLHLGTLNGVNDQRAQNKNKAQRKYSKTAMENRAIVKRDPKSKGATSISNLPPPGFADNSKGTTKLFVFGSEGNSAVSNESADYQLIQAPTKGKSCEVQEAVGSNAGLEVAIAHHGKAIVEQQQPQTNEIEMITQGEDISKDQQQTEDTMMVGAGASAIES